MRNDFSDFHQICIWFLRCDMDHSNLDSVSSCSDSSSLFSSSTLSDSMEEDEENEVTSSASSSSLNHQLAKNDPLQDMPSLIQQLPLIRRRGLSKHYSWKSQSFTSLAKVSCLEDLAKPEKPYKMMMKKKKRRYGGGLSDHDHSHRSNSLSRIISKKTITKGSYCSSFSQTAKRNSRPPMASPPNSTINYCISNSNQTALFAST